MTAWQLDSITASKAYSLLNMTMIVNPIGFDKSDQGTCGPRFITQLDVLSPLSKENDTFLQNRCLLFPMTLALLPWQRIEAKAGHRHVLPLYLSLADRGKLADPVQHAVDARKHLIRINCVWLYRGQLADLFTHAVCGYFVGRELCFVGSGQIWFLFWTVYYQKGYFVNSV